MRRDEQPPERVAVLLLAFAPLLVIPVLEIARSMGPSLDEPPGSYGDVCPAFAGQPMGVLSRTEITTNPDNNAPSYTTSYERYTAYDPLTGVPLAKASIGEHKNTSFLECMATTAQDIWLRTPTDGIHVRNSRTGALVKDEKTFFAGITGPVDKAWFEPRVPGVMVATKDGRNHEIKLDTSGRGKDPRRDLYWVRDQDLPTSAGLLYFATSPAGGGSVSRNIVFLGDKALADTDWLNPAFGIYPATGKIEWPNPPSLMICEPTEVGAPRKQVTRVALDGTILWTYTPTAKPARTAPECAWYVSGDATRLVLFTQPNGMIGIDAATGREVYRRVQ